MKIDKNLAIFILVSFIWFGLSITCILFENVVLLILLWALAFFFVSRNIYRNMKYKHVEKGSFYLYRIVFWVDVYYFLEIGPPSILGFGAPYLLGLELSMNVSFAITAILYYLYLVARKSFVPLRLTKAEM